MKTLILPTLVLFLLITFFPLLTAQQYWKGGFPGQETCWNHPYGLLPNEHSLGLVDKKLQLDSLFAQR